jgi:hypothetical protein
VRDTAENIIDSTLEALEGACDSGTLIGALGEGGYLIMETDRIGALQDRINELERKNMSLGMLANGGVPLGYALIKEENL